MEKEQDSLRNHAEHGDHSTAEYHHHHSHAAQSAHVHGHHLLQVEDLSVSFTMYDHRESRWSSKRRISRVIDNLSLSVHEGEILAIVGASGSGKTLLADAIMGLYASNSTVTGTIYFDGEKQTADSLKELRGGKIAFVPQTVKSLNPLMKVGRQIGGLPEKRAELFKRYGLGSEVEQMYPFELSGGMARRILLCTALISNPKLIIADEPTPGLDLDLAVKAMADFRQFANEGGGVLLITHDIELALRVADRVAVFKDGTVVEETSVENFASPDLLQHPFSKMLWHALPEHDFAVVDNSPLLKKE
ncbi:MAG: ATP-binding cassette domain-containing protein [Anaerotardibacter sp.]